ncbi:MAG: DNA polymerase/3'-5' exonuclease PolX [Deltaproteobacteria bacterium]|nr:DNA polymerase/3'-5' exonuclease PolX [Deltaproteobacteria bacterium]
MDKAQIAQILEEIAEILEIKGENPFKVRAYSNAARIVGGLTEDLGALIKKNQLIEIKGIGKNLAEHIEELHKTGRLKEYEKMLKEIPAGVFEIMKVPGVGPKKAKVLWEKLHVTDVTTLEHCCHHGKIAHLAGFGEKTQQKIMEGIAQIKKHAGKFIYPQAIEAAQNIFPKIEKNSKVLQAAIAGSLRRCREIVGDIDIVVASKNPKPVMNAFVKLPQVERVLAHGETKASVVLKIGMQSDLRCVTIDAFPFALHHFTGSKEHNVRMRQLALEKGWKLNEYGLFDKNEKRIPCKDEAELFGKFGLQYIPPELREGLGEIEAARENKIPKLVEVKDIRGVFHCHSTWSDGTATIEQMVTEAKSLGFEYYGTADHSQAAVYAGGLTPQRVKEQFKEIDGLNKKIKGVHIFKGIEADILADGTVDMGDAVLSTFDYVVASIHSKFKMTEKEMTARIIKAIKNKYVRILGHMTGRLLLAREGYPVNMTDVINACADHGVAIEINSSPMRLDIDWRHIPYCLEKKVMLVINPDAHSVHGISDFKFGVGIARKGWATAKNILNTRTLDEVKQWLNR